jgi:hypothetical protein
MRVLQSPDDLFRDPDRFINRDRARLDALRKRPSVD